MRTETLRDKAGNIAELSKEVEYASARQKTKAFAEDEENQYLTEPKFNAQRNQLTLMYMNGRSDYFISEIFNRTRRNMQVGMIDNLRIIAYLTDEGCAVSHLDDELSPPDVKDTVFDYMVEKRSPALKTNEEILEELREARKRFDQELNYLKEERQSTKDFYNTYFKGIESDQNTIRDCIQESAERASKLVASEKEQEIKELKAELEACKKERDQALSDAEEFKKNEQECLKALITFNSAENDPSANSPDSKSEEEADIQEQESEEKNKQNLSKKDERRTVRKKFNKHEEQKRVDLLVDAIADKSRSKEQFEVIADAYKKGLSLKGLEKLRRTETPLENLKLMEEIMVRKELGVEALKE